ncbi:MAG: hypothetical protein ACOCQY_01345 [Halorhabdus sp.]
MAHGRSKTLVWAAGALAWVLGMVATRPLVGSDQLIVVGQWFIEAVPGSIATWAIESFGQYARPMLATGIGTGVVAGGSTCRGTSVADRTAKTPA